MLIRTFISQSMEANCYLITKEVNNEVFNIIIDPCVEYAKVIKNIKKGNSHQIDAILITHAHCDHFDKLYTYLQNYKGQIFCHPKALDKINSRVKNCAELCKNTEVFNYSFDNFKTITNEITTLNKGKESLSFTSIETFGHTNCSLSFLFETNLFTGDFLFKKSIGRTDLYSGNDLLMKLSIEKIKHFALGKQDLISVYPGHGESTILSEEIKTNYYLN